MLKKVVPSAILIMKEEKELYVEIYHFNKDIVDSNHAFFQITKEKPAEIFQSKGKAFHMMTNIWKSEEGTK